MKADNAAVADATLPEKPQVWTGDHLTFRAAALAQRASGTIDVYESGVRREFTLPWLLARFPHSAQRVIGHKGQLMLERSSSSFAPGPSEVPGCVARP
jgi:hypothetical protein